MTVSDVMAIVEMRLMNMFTEHNWDYGTLLSYIRDARRDLFTKTHAYKEWSWQQTVAAAHLSAIPADYIRPTRLVGSPAGSNPVDNIMYEARRVDPREWAKVSGPRQMSFTYGFGRSPVYMVWANTNDDPLTWASSPMALWIHPNTFTGQFEYTASYADATLASDTDRVLVPVEMEGLLIDMVVYRVLQDYGALSHADRLSMLDRQIDTTLSSIIMSTQATLVNEGYNVEAPPAPQPVQAAEAVQPKGGRA